MSKKKSALSFPELLVKLKNQLAEKSLKVAEKQLNGENIADDVKEINSIKKNLTFAEKMMKELNVTVADTNSPLPPSLIKKIRKMESTVGEIVREIPKHGS